MAGPMPGLLSLVEELYGRMNKERLFGGGVRGAATRGLLGAQPAEDMTPTQRDVYENAVRISAPAQGLTALKAATVFHGSPAKFKRFDPTKIGSGEGAQVYGYGHYVAENPAVAKEYQRAVSKDKLITSQGYFDPAELEHLNVRAAMRGGDLDKAINLARQYGQSDSDYPEAAAKAARDLARLEAIKQSGGAQTNPGAFYKIDLPDEQIARMLDWDKPFSQQAPEVKKMLRDAQIVGKDDWLISGMRGREIYNRASFGAPSKLPLRQQDDQIFASQRLREAGIPGIRYLDQGSRSKFSVQNLYKGQPYGEPVSFMTELQAKEYAAEQVKKGFETKMLPGTSNFVVFPGEEELLRILERNGVPITSLLD